MYIDYPVGMGTHRTCDDEMFEKIFNAIVQRVKEGVNFFIVDRKIFSNAFYYAFHVES
ncbi:MAG: hypothetical protein N2316_13885 [Spirochaetes bacterium]|nr:hypothetical protein [Spirochaetota bacterium]